MESWIKDLKFYLMPSRQPVKGFERQYEEAYQVWRNAWQKFRNEIGVSEHLYSDGFILPDEMGVLFYQDECVGFTSYSHGHLDHGPLVDLGWFKAWTPEAILELSKISNSVTVCSQFTVNPKFAGKGHIIRWKDIISLYTLMRFEVADTGVMAGHLNLTRGMQNASGEESGATVLNSCHPFSYYGVEIPAQLVAYERKNIQLMKERKNIVPLCENLWSRLVHLSDHSVGNNVIPLRKAA
ncbi:MAG: hypothetical protein ACLGHN_02585 [Bacteriovoracia bacterium]